MLFSGNSCLSPAFEKQLLVSSLSSLEQQRTQTTSERWAEAKEGAVPEAQAPPPVGRVCSSSLLLRGMSAPAPPSCGSCSSPSSRPPGLLQAAEGKSQAIWGFPHRFWKFYFLPFGTTIRGGTGRDRSLWLWHFASVAQILLLKKSLLQAEFYYFSPFSFSFLSRRGHIYPRVASNIVEDNLELQTILPPPPERWSYRCVFTALSYKLNTH